MEAGAEPGRSSACVSGASRVARVPCRACSALAAGRRRGRGAGVAAAAGARREVARTSLQRVCRGDSDVGLSSQAEPGRSAHENGCIETKERSREKTASLILGLAARKRTGSGNLAI